MRTPTVYVVQWPELDIIKVGFSEVSRWKRFEFSGAEVLRLYHFDSAIDAYAVEAWIHEDARRLLLPAFPEFTDEARELLGGNGAGHAECYIGQAEDALEVIAQAMRRADAQASDQADAQASEAEHYHGRTYGTDALRTASPTRANSPSVTRGRAYGIEAWS